MSTTVNELGEFNVPDVFDPDLNRARAYRCCASVDMARVRRSAQRDERGPGRRLGDVRECPNCGRAFERKTPCQQYCTPKCRREKYNEARRAEYAARRRTRP